MNLSKPFAGDYPVTMGFGDRSIHKNGHSGIDYALPVSTPVLAAADGVVVMALLDNTGYGYKAAIEHPEGYVTIYAHLQRWIVREGQHMTRGMVIGYSGGAPGMEGAGFSTGAHLHFELRKKPFRFTDAVDPAPFLREVAAVKLQKPSQVTVVAPVVRVRLEPGLSGSFIRWAWAGEQLHATGRRADADGLRWREVMIPAWVAERDGTDELIREAEIR